MLDVELLKSSLGKIYKLLNIKIAYHLNFRNFNFKNKMTMIDYRSDTVTKPSKEMLDAMFNAKVGDDFYKEDTTVN
jgi:hypothetical protein